MGHARQGLMKRDVRSGRLAGLAGRLARRGFTLIEVVIAMSILVVVVLALLSSYTFYYRSITNLRIQSVGENLAQLQLEDVRNMGTASFKAVLGSSWGGSGSSPSGAWPARSPVTYDCPNYPPAELFYQYDSTPSSPSLLGWYSYARDWGKLHDPTLPIGLENRPVAWNYTSGLLIGTLIPPTPNDLAAVTQTVKENLARITYDGSYRPIEYDSGERDADFVVEGLTSVPSGVLVLPDSITVTPSAPGAAAYTLDVSKLTYPNYKKRSTITDETPGEADSLKKLYEVSVTVYWTANGSNQSVTVKQEVSFEGQT